MAKENERTNVISGWEVELDYSRTRTEVESTHVRAHKRTTNKDSITACLVEGVLYITKFPVVLMVPFSFSRI